MDGGVVRMELHHYTNPVPARRTRRQPMTNAQNTNPTFNVQVGMNIAQSGSVGFALGMCRWKVC